MKRTITISVCVIAIISAAAGISPVYARTEHGYLKGTGESSSFTITSPGPTTDITVSYPKGSVDFWVSTVDQSGTVSRYDLDNWDSIRLTGAGLFTVTVYSRNGAGDWTAEFRSCCLPAGVLAYRHRSCATFHPAFQQSFAQIQ